MNYVDNVGTRVFFINKEDKKQKPIFAEWGYDYGYDLYRTMEFGRKYVKSNDFGFRASLLMKKAR